MIMIYDEKMLAVEQKIDQLVSAIANSDICEEYQSAHKKLTDDPDALILRQVFAEKKDRYEAVTAYGEYAPGFMEVRSAVMAAKRQLDLQPTVAEYRLRETRLQTLLDEITKTIAHKIDEKIKVDAGNPFFETGGQHEGCGGNCHAS